MDSRKIVQTLFVIFVSAFATFLQTSCSGSNFTGKSHNDGSDNSEVSEPSSLKHPTWIEESNRKLFKSLFDEAAVGSKSKSKDGDGIGESLNETQPIGDQLVDGVDGVLWIPCADADKKLTEYSTEFYGKKGSSIRLSGEFCPPGADSKILNVLFIIDRSASMEGVRNALGNDRTNGGTCGRLRASKVLVDKYKALKDAKVNAGVINFASHAKLNVSFGDIKDLDKALNEDIFCGFDPADGSLTNYQAAFSAARKAIKDMEGPKVIYFITDGEPSTVSGSVTDFEEAAKAGLKAADDLRKEDDVYLFALFVGHKGNKKSPKEYLEKITGDPSSVEIVADADELVKAAASLGVGGPMKLSKDDTSITIKSSKGEDKIGIAAFLPSPKKSGAYIWATTPFVLLGESGKTSANTVTAKTKLPDGGELRTIAEILFKQKD